MDKNIEAEVLPRRRRKIIIFTSVLIALFITSIFLFRSSFASSIKKTAITTSVVDQGDIENTLEATGEILPEFEEVITSPINASIKSVLIAEGTSVKTGESILTLDKSTSEAEFERLKFLLASKQNDIKKLRLNLTKSFYDIQSNDRIKELQINSLAADVENARRLFKAGGGTREDIEKSELALKVAKEEKLKLENEIKTQQLTMQAEIKEVEIAAAIQQNDLDVLKRKLQLANIVATRNGVVTWVNKNIGLAIHEGETLTRIANLTSFKVQGSIADHHMNELHRGMPAVVRINDKQIKGTITTIQPTIQNGIATFTIQLSEPNSPLLRPNMKVDIFLVTASKKNALRVANGPAFQGASSQDIFILQNGKAYRRNVRIGLTNFDYVEILDQVKPGDIVITSDMSKFKNASTITIIN